jgi:hypothetical protein
MKHFYRIYIFSLSGALGGLTASFLHQYLLLDTLSSQLDIYSRFGYLALLGAIIGISIGFFPSFIEGKGKYSLRGAIRAGIIGALLGAVGGSIALPLAELIHIKMGGGLTGRVIAMAFLGLTVGIAEAIVGGARSSRGILGGIIGGIVAGAVLEFLLPYQLTHADSGILALILIGFFIALFIALFVNVLASAQLEVQPGSPTEIEGRVYHLDKYRDPFQAFLGSDKEGLSNIWIPKIELRHASIALTDAGALLRHVAENGETSINGSPISEQILRDGDLIQLGGTKLKYSERQKVVMTTAEPLKKKA